MLQSIYTHAGCDYGCLYTYSPRHCFNPHTHAGCDTNSFYSNTIILCFNPHTHAGCDYEKRVNKPEANVSIHTPTQGVTFSVITVPLSITVSIHTPTQGVTLPSGLINPHRTRFNPHTHAGCDYSCFAYCYSRQNVSIHTPTQGVTPLIIKI